jgi:bacterioferritin-associated ferredoxin
MTLSESERLETAPTQCSGEEDSLVCYCHRLTTGMLKSVHAKLGSLKAVEDATGAGKACTGCKVILQSLFGEAASDDYHLDESPVVGSTCKKPGNRLMKGFIVADGNLESTVYSSNGIAPQLGNCDADTPIEYLLLDHRGVPVLHRKSTLKTNQTFVFDTRKEDFPRPFYGQFMLIFGRSNYGASRFNIYWGNKNSVSATHENSNTGRPRVVLPLAVDRKFLAGSSKIHLGLMNPHQATIKFSITARDLDTQGEITWETELPQYCSMWVNASDYLFKPALEARPDSRFVIEVRSKTDMHNAISVYFFLHNQENDLWTVNHL